MLNYSCYKFKSHSNSSYTFIDQSLYECCYEQATTLYLIGNTHDILLQDTLIQSMIEDNYIQQQDLLSIYYCDYIPITCITYLNYLNYLYPHML